MPFVKNIFTANVFTSNNICAKMDLHRSTVFLIIYFCDKLCYNFAHIEKRLFYGVIF